MGMRRKVGSIGVITRSLPSVRLSLELEGLRADNEQQKIST
jgi:hypothetical protein